MKRNFVVVAHDDRVREALARDLCARGYSVTRAATGKQAEQIVSNVVVDAVVVESHLPDLAPAELRARLTKLRPDCRVVVLTDFQQVRNTPEQLRHGNDACLLRTSELLDLIEAPFANKSDNGSSFAARGNDALIEALDVAVGLVELDQRHFGGFSHQAMRLARAVAQELTADEENVREIVIATLLHDMGKVGVAQEVIEEKGWYSADQRERMKSHVEGSMRLFEHIDFPWKVLPIIRHHHERYDGNGYPDGLRGREIPLGARVVSAVDAFVALTSGRNHRGAFDSDQALTMMIVEAGRQFDPEVVEAFQKVLDKRRRVTPDDHKPTILIVAAQEEHRKVIKLRLVNEGFAVGETKSCKRALKRSRHEPPDLMLIDLDVDKTEAFRLLRGLREDESLYYIPVVFISRQSDRILKLRALREGVDDFLCKDGDLEEQVARVGNILTRETARRGGKIGRVRHGITGDLENLGLADIVQTLSMGMKTACVTLRSDDRTGQIWFENGALRHAELDGTEGEPAFYEMIRWSEGSFVIEHGVRTKQLSVEHDAMYLVMEGLRLLDESGSSAAAAASTSTS